VLLVLCSAVCFGTAGIFAKFAFAAGLNVSSTLALRYSLAGVAVWVVVLGRHLARSARSETLGEGVGSLRLRGRSLLAAVGIGIGGYGLANWLYFWGLQSLTAGRAAIVFYTYPLFVLVLSTSLLGERLTTRLGLSLPLGITGVALLAGIGGNPATIDPIAVAIVAGAALAYAVHITGSRSMLGTIDPVIFTAHLLPTMSVAYWGAGFALGRLQLPETTSSWSIVLLLAIVATAIPTLALCAGLTRIEANRASVLGMAEPLAAVVLGAIVLSEPVTATTVLGGLLIVGGAYLSQSE
jgi:drug/metabolite transporter (DMT)-like permease